MIHHLPENYTNVVATSCKQLMNQEIIYETFIVGI